MHTVPNLINKLETQIRNYHAWRYAFVFIATILLLAIAKTLYNDSILQAAILVGLICYFESDLLNFFSSKKFVDEEDEYIDDGWLDYD